MTSQKSIVPVERIERSILLIRGRRVMLDVDLAELYGVETKVLNQAVQHRAVPRRFYVSIIWGGV